MPPTLAMCLGKVMLRCRHKLTPKFQWPHSRVAFGSLTWQSNVGVPGWPCDFPPGGDSGTLASSILWSHHLPVPRGLSYVQRTGSTWRNHMCLLKPLSWEVIISTRLVRISHTHIVCLDERRAGDIPHWAVDCQKKKTQQLCSTERNNGEQAISAYPFLRGLHPCHPPPCCPNS